MIKKEKQKRATRKHEILENNNQNKLVTQYSQLIYWIYKNKIVNKQINDT